MKFLITSSLYAPFGFGGTATYACDLAEGLVQRGHEVHVMFSQDMYEFHRSSWKAAPKTEIPREQNGVFLHPVRSSLGSKGVYLTYLTGSSPAFEKQFRQMVEQIKPDVVHHQHLFAIGYKVLMKQGTYFNLFKAHDYWAVCPREDLMWRGKVPCRKKACLWCGLSSLGDRRPPQLWRWMGNLTRALRDVDLISTPSLFMTNRLAEELKGRIEYSANFVPRPPQNLVSSGYENYFLYAGLLKPQKGVLQLLEVFRKHGAEIPARLLLAGTGPLEAEIKAFITRYNLEDKVVPLGWVERPRLWSLYRDALALVMPSVWPENNPLVALEALAAGTPAIGSDMGGIPEIVQKIDKNLVFHNGDWERLAGILSGFDRKKYTTEKMKQIFLENYSREEYLKRYEKLVKEGTK